MKYIIALMFFVFLLCTGSRVFAINYTFTGSGSWSSSPNWDVNGIPPNPLLTGDTIIINGTGPAILDIDQTITIGSYLSITSSKTLTINSAKSLVINETTFVISSGGTLNNNGILSINLSIPNVTQGNLNSNGSLNNNTGGAVNIYQASVLNNSGILQNDGILNILGGSYTAILHNNNGNLTNNGILNIKNRATLINNGIGLVLNTVGGILNTYPYSGGMSAGFLRNDGTASLINNGILNNNGSTANWTVAVIINDSTLNNNGYMENQNVLRNNSILHNNSTLYNNILDSLINNGTFNNNGILDNQGVFNNNNTLSNTGIFNNLSPLGELILNTNPAFFPGGTFNWNVGSGVKIGPNGIMTLTSPVTFEAGKKLTLAPGSTLNVQQ